VAKWLSRPPQEQKIPGSYPAWVSGFRSLYIAVLLSKLNTHCNYVCLRKNKCYQKFFFNYIDIRGVWAYLACSMCCELGRPVVRQSSSNGSMFNCVHLEISNCEKPLFMFTFHHLFGANPK
jgi:hypothetical protein